MKAKELAEELLKFPEFDVIFAFSEINENGFNNRRFENIKPFDVGYSSKVILLDGDEDL